MFGNDEELIPIYQSTDLGRTEVVRLALESEGIQCALENENQAGFSGVLQCRLFVRESDAEAARELIRSHESHGVNNTEQPHA